MSLKTLSQQEKASKELKEYMECMTLYFDMLDAHFNMPDMKDTFIESTEDENVPHTYHGPF